MRNRVPRAARTLLFVAASPFLAACVEMDRQVELREDGTGTIGSSLKLGQKFIKLIKRVEELDPTEAANALSNLDFPVAPDDATRAEMEKAGLRILECAKVNSATEISGRVRFEFRDLTALRQSARMETSGTDGKPRGDGLGDEDVWLSRNQDGLYTLAIEGTVSSAADRLRARHRPGTAATPGGDPGPPKKAPDLDEKEREEMMGLMTDLIGDGKTLKFVYGVKVPGEIRDYHPKDCAKVDGGRVTWTFDFDRMMRFSMDGAKAALAEGGSPKITLCSVDFRMAEGRSIPDSALRPRKTEKATPAPATPAPSKPASPVSPSPDGER